MQIKKTRRKNIKKIEYVKQILQVHSIQKSSFKGFIIDAIPMQIKKTWRKNIKKIEYVKQILQVHSIQKSSFKG